MHRSDMIQSLRLAVLPAAPLAQVVRAVIVLGCSLALILAGKSFPL